MKYVYLTLDDLLDMFDDENTDKNKNQHTESDKQSKEKSDKNDTLTEVYNSLINLLAEYYGYEDVDEDEEDESDCQENDKNTCDAGYENLYSKLKSANFNEDDVKNIHDKKIETVKETKQHEKIKITKSEALYLLGFDEKDFEIV